MKERDFLENLLYEYLNQDNAFHTNIILLGNSGSGKSLFLKNLTIGIIDAFQHLKIYPIYIKLDSYASLEDSQIRMKSISEILNTMRFSFKNIEDLKKEKVIFLIDGLNEIRSRKQMLE